MKVIALSSFAGGVGKTTIAVETARALANLDKTVLIIDFDISCPGMGLTLELEEEDFTATLNDYLLKHATLQDAVYDITDRLEVKKGEVFIIPSYAKHSIIAQTLLKGVSYDRLSQLIDRIKKRYAIDYIIVDTHSGITGESLIGAEVADLMVILTGTKNKDYMGTLAYTRVAKKIGVPSVVLINKLRKGMSKAEWTKKYEELTGEQVIGRIPYSLHFQTHMGIKTFTDKHDNPDFRDAMKRIVERVQQLDEVKEEKRDRPPKC